jgi:orotidine-5'-phosphate decarboxylase
MFIDKLINNISANGSILCAGFDPDITLFPEEAYQSAVKAASDEEALFTILTKSYGKLLEQLAPHIAALKPNIAFFEQYGIGGLRALSRIIQFARELSVPVILDVKRGDIGSTAEAYARAYLAPSQFQKNKIADFEADAITVNPFLGLDSLEPFLAACKDNGKGMFVLVKTSNPGSKDFQIEAAATKLTSWLAANAPALSGSRGFSGLGAVIGATHPEEAQHFRSLLPKNWFLIPGYGAQGASAKDAVAGLNEQLLGGVVNVSRGLFPKIKHKSISEWCAEIVQNAKRINQELNG